MITLIVQRDSVCAGDDADAPHELQLPLAPQTSLAELLQHVLQIRYLASIAGGEATWIVEDGDARALAVVAQQWPHPRFVASPDTPAAALLRTDRPRLFFKYWCQVDPDRVFASVRDGRPLPDRRARMTR